MIWCEPVHDNTVITRRCVAAVCVRSQQYSMKLGASFSRMCLQALFSCTKYLEVGANICGFLWVLKQKDTVSFHITTWLIFTAEVSQLLPDVEQTLLFEQVRPIKHKPYKALRSLHIPPGLTFNNSTFSQHSEFICFVWIWEQKAIISYTALTDWFI